MIALEDELEDIISKAMAGWEICAEDLSTRTSVPIDSVNEILDGNISDWATMERIARCLKLDFDSLRALGEGLRAPTIDLPDGLYQFNEPFPVPGYAEMRVNHYLFRPEDRSACFAIDTGPSALPVAAKQNSSSCLKHLFLTHTHRDHMAALAEYQKLGATAYAPEREVLRNSISVKHGDHFEFEKFRLRALSTSGHSPGGTSYVLEGLECSVVFVGDAIFCCSVGKAHGLLEQALAEVRQNILSLPLETVICPGHGPITTVAFELKNNPFFA